MLTKSYADSKPAAYHALGGGICNALKAQKDDTSGGVVAHVTCIARPFLQAKTYNGIDVKLFQRNVYTWDLQEPSVRNTVAYIFRISHGQFWYGLLSCMPRVLTLRNYYHRFLLFRGLLVQWMLFDAATKK